MEILVRGKVTAVFLGVCLGLPLLSYARPAAPFDAQQVVTQQRVIRQKIEGNDEQYSHLSGREKRELISRQDELLSVLQGREYGDLSDAERATVLDTREWISERTERRDDDRMVCERVRKIGSNRVERVCMTAGERDRQREQARQAMEKRSEL